MFFVVGLLINLYQKTNKIIINYILNMKIMKNIIIVFVLLFIIAQKNEAQSTVQKPIRLAIVGMTHGHIAFILGRKDKKDFQLVGVFEPNTEVDDEATLIVTYPKAQCIIQASWNWPFGRKDMEIYGDSGYIVAVNNNSMRLRNGKMQVEQLKQVTSKDIAVYEDPFSYFADVINGKVNMTKYDPYSLSNNLVVVKILDAARESAKTGKTIVF